MAFLSKPKKKESSVKFKNEMLQLKKDVKKLIKSIEQKKEKKSKKIYVEPVEPSDSRINQLENELRDLKEKYFFVLEKLAQSKPERKDDFPKPISNRLTPSKRQTANLGHLQILHLLKDSRATNREFAVTAEQLKVAFSINRSTRTLRNKLNELEHHGYVIGVGSRPKVYFLTSLGLQMLESNKRTAISFENELFGD